MRGNLPAEVLHILEQGNLTYVSADSNPAAQFIKMRKDTAENGQKPYAVVLTCSDSRVPPEHIFSAGIGDLFVIRNAGNLVGDFELGSIEYACESLGAKVVVVMGHTCCGAIHAALSGGAASFIQTIADEIKAAIHGADSEVSATDRNIANSVAKIQNSPIIQKLQREDKLVIVSAKYDVETGKVTFF